MGLKQRIFSPMKGIPPPKVGCGAAQGKGWHQGICFLSPGPRCTPHTLTPSPHIRASLQKSRSMCCQPSKSKLGFGGDGVGTASYCKVWAFAFARRGCFVGISSKC